MVGTPKMGMPSKTGCASDMASKISHEEIATKKTNIETVEPWVFFFSVLSYFVQGVLKQKVKIKKTD